MTSTPTRSPAEQALRRAARVARRSVRRLAARTASAPAAAPAPDRPLVDESFRPILSPATALRENGFTIFRGLFTPHECAQFAARLKSEAGISTGAKHTKVDATNSYATARELMLEGRIIDAVRSALGDGPRFLQVSDLHYLHDTAGWHRDSVHRAHDASEAPDWRPDAPPFGVVKAILYLESDNAAMGIMAGSHLSPHEMDHAGVKAVEARGGQIVLDASQNPNQRLSPTEKKTPLAWKAEVGDVLVFDERMYHAGRRVDAGKVSTQREAPKFTLSLVFGRDNEHSARMYSYFRFVRRELSYRDLGRGFADELARRDLVMDQGWTNIYRRQPDNLRHVYLPDPSRLEPLLEEYTAGETSGAQ